MTFLRIPTTDELPTPHEVEAALDDWRRRLGQLFLDIRGWVPPDAGFRVVEGEDVVRSEPVMDAVGVGRRSFPRLTIADPRTGAELGFRPDALWVVGTNGRVHVTLPGSRTYLVHVGNAEDRGWRIYPLRDRTRGVPFDEGELRLLLAELAR